MESNPENLKAANELIKKGVTSLTILTGKAPEQKNPTPVHFSGTISAPRLFIEKRKDGYDKNLSHCAVDRTIGQICLIVDEKNPNDHYKIIGKITGGSIFSDLGINKGTPWTTEELAKSLRMLRSAFSDKDAHAKTIKNLRDFRAKINKEVEKAADDRGNKTSVFKQVVESNVPETFSISIPLVEGEKEEAFDVSILFEVGNSGEVLCTLESVEAKEMLDNRIKQLIDSEVAALQEYTTIMFVS